MDQQPGLKIIRPTAIRTNFSDGFGLQKLGLGQDRAEKSYRSQMSCYKCRDRPYIQTNSLMEGLNLKIKRPKKLFVGY